MNEESTTSRKIDIPRVILLIIGVACLLIFFWFNTDKDYAPLIAFLSGYFICLSVDNLFKETPNKDECP